MYPFFGLSAVLLGPLKTLKAMECKELIALRGTRRGGMEAKRLGDLEALELVGAECAGQKKWTEEINQKGFGRSK